VQFTSMTVGESPSPGTDPLIDQLVADRYRMIRKLGEGGMGSVYLAEHVVIEKKIVLKVLAAELAMREDLVARFLQEARSASRIGHENVIDISDFGQSAEGFVYIAMEYLEGRDLGQVLHEEGALPWNRVREIVMQICRALRAAHDKGIVHRDMKPENIFLIHREGRPEFVKILDFGIAKVMGLDPKGPRLTRAGMIFGTPEYMAPEQAEGKETDHRADVYAVGCIVYHLMTGETPFVADSFMAMLTKQMSEQPIPPSVRRPDLAITPEMDALVAKALEKNRDKRFQNMAEFREAVSACRGPDQTSGSLPAVSYTREMGGAHARAALNFGKTEERPDDATPVPRTSAEEEAAQVPERAAVRSVRSRPNLKVILTIVGLLLGAAGGVSLALYLGRSPKPLPAPAVEAPAPVAAPAPVPASTPAIAPVPVVAPAAAAPSPPPPAPAPPAAEVREAAPEASAHQDAREHGHKPKPGRAHPATVTSKSGAVAPASASPAPAPVKQPPALAPGLKPFPGQ